MLTKLPPHPWGLTPGTDTKKKHKKVCLKQEVCSPLKKKKHTNHPLRIMGIPMFTRPTSLQLRKRLQALQLGGPAALAGALVAIVAAGINGELAAVAAGLKWEAWTKRGLGVEFHDFF